LFRSRQQLRADALAAWQAGLDAVRPEVCVARALERRPDIDPASRETLVVAVGKAAAGMLRGLCAARGLDAASPSGVARAIVLLPDGAEADGLPSTAIVLRGGHPHPSAGGMTATLRILDEAARLGAGGRLLVLLSGGASALLEAPAPGLSFEDVAASHRALVASGLPIASINLVRGCLSAVKAGRLAERAWPAAVTTLAISDVEGDDPAVIGSGPTVVPTRSRRELCCAALDVVTRAAVALPAGVIDFLERSAEESPDGERAEDFTVIASVAAAVGAARGELRSRGYCVDAPPGGDEYLRGDTSSAVARILSLASDVAASAADGGSTAASEGGTALHSPAARGVVVGGETTVAVSTSCSGRGGRNLHLAAYVALAIAGRDGVAVVAAGTDGGDGSSRAAGAVVDGGTAARAAAAGLALTAALERFDTEPALEAAGDLVVTGPTGTNVGDLVVVARG